MLGSKQQKLLQNSGPLGYDNRPIGVNYARAEVGPNAQTDVHLNAQTESLQAALTT